MVTPDPGVMSGDAWDVLVDRVAGLKELVYGPGVPSDELHRSEGVRYLLRYLAAGIATCVEHDDVDRPEIGTLIENRRSWGLDNPDTKYGFCRLAPDAPYVIRGDPGTACEIELQVATQHFADGDYGGWRSLSRLARDDLVLEDDGSVEVVVAPQRPDDARNWLATGPDASYLHVRECFADWIAERPALFDVERSDVSGPAAELDSSTLAARLELLGVWLDVGARCWDQMGVALAGAEPGPVTPFLPPAGATGLGGQAYGMGGYRCAPDEAVILEFEPPDCRYWSVSLATWFWESADIANRQCSLNHRQAMADPDGVVRLVIAHDDPGLANWLDPAGYERGTIAVRFLHAATSPTVGHRVIPRDALELELPMSPRVTGDDRARALRSRRLGVVHRYRR